MEPGVIIPLTDKVESDFEQIASLGFKTCQLSCRQPDIMSDETAKKVNALTERFGITITAFWCGWSGPAVYDFYSGPVTLGIVPPAYREIRVRELKRSSDFAKLLGVEDIDIIPLE